MHLRGFDFLAYAPRFFFETVLSLYVSLQLHAGKTKKLQQKRIEWKTFAVFLRQSVSVPSLLVLHLLCSCCHSLHVESDLSWTRPSFAHKTHTDSSFLRSTSEFLFFLFLFLISFLAICAFLMIAQSKLDDYQTKKNKGERLNQDQLVRQENVNLEAAFAYCSLLQHR